MTDKYLADTYKLKNLIRYNTRTRLKDESVAEHSFFVALFTLDICKQYHIDTDTTAKCCIKAVLHDMPEIVLNDITHDVKEKLNLREILKPYEDEYYEINYPEHAELMIKGSELVNLIVDLADAYSVKQYVKNEINLGNSSSDIFEIQLDIKQRINILEKKLHTLAKELNYV